MGSKIYPKVHENPRAFFSSSSPSLLESSIQYPWGVGLHQPLVTAEDLSQTNDHVGQFGSECTFPGGRDMMSLCSHIFGN